MYAYQGDMTIEKELEAAERAKEEARKRIEARRAQLVKLRQSRKQVEALIATEHRLVSEIRQITFDPVPMPAPKYGGREGLRRAAEEAAEWSRSRKNSRTRPTAA